MCSSIGADTNLRNTWCSEAPNQPPSSPSLTYDAANANEVCANTPCNQNEPTDVALCCLDPSKAKCRTIWDAANGVTTPDATFCDNNNKAYDPAKANAYCAAVGDGAACSKGPDANTCCGTKATCLSIKTQANWCGSGKVYKGADSTACASTTCTATDVSTCCVAQCSTIAPPSPPTETFCNVVPPNGVGAVTKVYASSQASATCAAAACSSATSGDIAACCRPKAKCSTIRSTAQSESPSPFCGSGKIYNVAADDENCALDTCAAHNVANNDVGTCCIDRAKCLTIKDAAQDADDNAFDCGSGQIYDTSKDDELCASSTCTSAGGANDIGTCCVAQGSGSAPGSLLARVPAAPSARRATGGSG